jgi:hypothetical protein
MNLRPAKLIFGFLYRVRLRWLGRSLGKRVNGLANTSRISLNGLVLRSSLNTATSQNCSTVWSRMDYKYGSKLSMI